MMLICSRVNAYRWSICDLGINCLFDGEIRSGYFEANIHISRSNKCKKLIFLQLRFCYFMSLMVAYMIYVSTFST